MTTTSQHGQTVVNIMRRLPRERQVELLDFARFLEIQTAVRDESYLKEAPAEDPWGELSVRPEAKRLLREMAYEACADYEAGQTTDIGAQDGRLTAE